jgi:hypothetical protein
MQTPNRTRRRRLLASAISGLSAPSKQQTTKSPHLAAPKPGENAARQAIKQIYAMQKRAM